MVDYTMCSEFPFGEVRFTCCKCSSYSNTESSGDGIIILYILCI